MIFLNENSENPILDEQHAAFFHKTGGADYRAEQRHKDTHMGIFNDLRVWWGKKTQGYHVKEVDHFIAKAKHVDTEEERREMLKELHASIHIAREALREPKNEEHKRELTLQIEGLNRVLSIVNNIDIAKRVLHPEETNKDDE